MKTGRPIAYEGTLSYPARFAGCGTTYIAPGTFMDPEYLLEVVTLTPELVASDKWFVQEPTVTITRTQFWNAYRDCMVEIELRDRGTRYVQPNFVQDLAKRLGLEA